MLLVMQDFDFAQILITFAQILPQISPQFHPNLKIFCSFPATLHLPHYYGTMVTLGVVMEMEPLLYFNLDYNCG